MHEISIHKVNTQMVFYISHSLHGFTRNTLYLLTQQRFWSCTLLIKTFNNAACHLKML